MRKAARMSIVTMTIQLITNTLWVSATAVGAIPYQLCSSPSTSRASLSRKLPTMQDISADAFSPILAAQIVARNCPAQLKTARSGAR